VKSALAGESMLFGSRIAGTLFLGRIVPVVVILHFRQRFGKCARSHLAFFSLDFPDTRTSRLAACVCLADNCCVS